MGLGIKGAISSFQINVNIEWITSGRRRQLRAWVGEGEKERSRAKRRAGAVGIRANESTDVGYTKIGGAIGSDLMVRINAEIRNTNGSIFPQLNTRFRLLCCIVEFVD